MVIRMVSITDGDKRDQKRQKMAGRKGERQRHQKKIKGANELDINLKKKKVLSSMRINKSLQILSSRHMHDWELDVCT